MELGPQQAPCLHQCSFGQSTACLRNDTLQVLGLLGIVEPPSYICQAQTSCHLFIQLYKVLRPHAFNLYLSLMVPKQAYKHGYASRPFNIFLFNCAFNYTLGRWPMDYKGYLKCAHERLSYSDLVDAQTSY